MTVATRVQERSGSGIGVVPFRLDNARQIVLNVESVGPFADARPISFDAVLDTAAPETLRLPRSTAKRVHPWLRGGPPRGMTSPSGASRVYSGAVLELQVGSVSAGPVPITMDESEREYLPVIGLGFLRQFQSVIIDWQEDELLLVKEWNEAELARRFPAVKYDWIEVPLHRIERLHEESIYPSSQAAAGEVAEARPYQLDFIAVEASIGGERMTAIIDTGGSGDLLAFRNLPTVPGTEENVQASSDGQRGDLVRADLAPPLLVGPIAFDDIQVYRIRGDNRALISEGLPDIAIGNGALQRYTLWIDFEREVVRFGRLDGTADDS